MADATEPEHSSGARHDSMPLARPGDTTSSADKDWLECGGGVDIFIFTDTKATKEQGLQFKSSRSARGAGSRKSDTMTKGKDTHGGT